ncbi:DUF4232 domain-containing protein [Streptomyces sp. NPDC020917]|uniref:DUF4232 domain-containing protein n=1 Tax=Streptomyces sp. NPDC020917 TaxID=3365102 RepID=UPI003793C5DB
MRRNLLALTTATAAFGTLLITACGTQQSATRPPGTPPADSGSPSCTTPGGATTAPQLPPSSGETEETDGVRLTGAPGCQEFEVTNTTGSTATFTITYQLMSESGAALSSSRQTVDSVPPGVTVRRAAGPGGTPAGTGSTTHVRIIHARSVPTAQAPTSAGPCPPSGVHLYADDGDAAMGLRVVGLRLRNCGTRAFTLDGYPQVQLFDAGHRAIGTVKILHGGDAVAAGTGADGQPGPLVLKPGEGAHAGLVWRNTTGLGSDPVNAPYVRVVAKPGTAPVMVTPELDLGTTGRLAVGPWKSDGTS